MPTLDSRHAPNNTPPPRLLPLLERIKSVYVIWYSYYQTLPKVHRYSLGQRTDTLFVEIIEAVAIAAYLPKTEKIPYVRVAIRKLDTIKILLLIMWEVGSLQDKQYIVLSRPLDEIGKMFGGWAGQLTKNSPATQAGEK
jgi:hypothetical protein